MIRHRPTIRPSQRGFSLLELVISMFIAVEILVAAALAFDVHNRIAAVQTQVTDLQQSLRVAQYDIVRTLRSAGRGGLPLELDPDAVYNDAVAIPDLRGLAIEVRNNVTGAERFIARGDATSRQAIAGSDILTVRGCISGTAYQFEPSTSGFDWDADNDDVADDNATLILSSIATSGIAQPLEPLVNELQQYTVAPGQVYGSFALVGSTALQAYAVADIVGFDISAMPATLTLTLDLNNDSTLNPKTAGVRQFPPELNPALGCYLEEYRYYVREVAGDAITAVKPRLTRARFEPGTELPFRGQVQNFDLDLADGIFDLQIALGLDTDFTVNGYSNTVPGSYEDDPDWIGPDDTIFEASAYDPAQNRARDDWLYNDPADLTADPTGLLYTTHQCSVAASCGANNGAPVQLYFVRVSVAGRTARPDRIYSAPELDTRADGDWIEDHDFDSAPGLAYNSGDSLKHRRRVLQAVVDMRNI